MLNLNIINGGTKENIVPGACQLTINRRYIVDERYDDVVAEIEEASRRGRAGSKLEDLRVSFVDDYPPVECDPKCPRSLEDRIEMGDSKA